MEVVELDDITTALTPTQVMATQVFRKHSLLEHMKEAALTIPKCAI